MAAFGNDRRFDSGQSLSQYEDRPGRPLFVPVPPDQYGGTERIVHPLTQELVKRGHEVMLFASAGSKTSAELHATSRVSCSRGSLPELIQDGRHGFIAANEDELVDACRRVTSLDREECRRWFLDRFSPERMTANYELVYKRLVAHHLSTNRFRLPAQ